MISSGIDALDHRLGGLAAGRYYLVSGPPGAGKTSVALHFLVAGLEAGEVCAILTQEDPGDLLTQAEFLGYDFRTPAESEQLIVLQYRLDFAHNYTRLADPAKLVEELLSLSGTRAPDRLVIDSIAPFVDTAGAAHETLAALAHLLDKVTATAYLTVPGELTEGRLWAAFDRIRTGAAGIFDVQIDTGKVREFTIQKVRQAAASTDPFRFLIRPGLGIVGVRENVRRIEEIDREMQNRLVILNLSAVMPEEFRAQLDAAYDVGSYDSVENAFSELSTGNFGVLLLAVDPRQPASAIALTRELRRSGNGVPILFVSESRDLRSSTRAKGLRAGADDYMTDDVPVQEFLQRVELARSAAIGSPPSPTRRSTPLMQPRDDAGEAMLIEEDEMNRFT